MPSLPPTAGRGGLGKSLPVTVSFSRPGGAPEVPVSAEQGHAAAHPQEGGGEAGEHQHGAVYEQSEEVKRRVEGKGCPNPDRCWGQGPGDNCAIPGSSPVLPDCEERVLEPIPVGMTELGLGPGPWGRRKAHGLVLQSDGLMGSSTVG